MGLYVGGLIFGMIFATEICGGGGKGDGDAELHVVSAFYFLYILGILISLIRLSKSCLL